MVRNTILNKKGFTLIELLVVIAVIGILTAVGLVAMIGAREKARDAKRKSDLGTVRSALQLYFDTYNGYPQISVVTGFGNMLSGPLYDSLVVGSNILPALPTPPQSTETYYYISCDTVAGFPSGDFTLFAKLERPLLPNAYWVISASKATTQEEISTACPVS